MSDKKKNSYIDFDRADLKEKMKKATEEELRNNSTAFQVRHKFLRTVKAGDTVVRMVAGTIPQLLTILEIDDKFIYCHLPDKPWPKEQCWVFDKTYGFEVDEDLGWGETKGKEVISGSFLVEAAKLKEYKA